ncbi:hypothetical protein L1887_23170 [Cichorium endivia]|nr:hypothetical protein L1887_23170 [Cichorium endivia]
MEPEVGGRLLAVAEAATVVQINVDTRTMIREATFFFNIKSNSPTLNPNSIDSSSDIVIRRDSVQATVTMVKAIRVYEFGGPEVMKWVDVELDEPKKGEIKVRNKAIGINYLEVYMRKGLVPRITPPSPFTPVLVRRCLQIGPEHTILVHAAAGGVGSLVCQWANALGATVIGTVSNKVKAVQAKEDGCHHVIIYKEENFLDRVMEITSRKGVDVVYDSVGKDTFEWRA